MSVDWAARRAQLQSDGVCIIEDVLDDAMLQRVRAIAAAQRAAAARFRGLVHENLCLLEVATD